MRKLFFTLVLVMCGLHLMAQVGGLEPITKTYTIKQFRYWFDDQTEPRTASYAGGTASIDAKALLEGYHTLHYQVVDDQGDVSPVRTTAFYRLSPSGLGFKEYAIKSVRYWFDDQTEPRTASYAGGTASIDAKALLEGYHTLHYQVVDDQGDLSPVRTTAFYRLSPSGLGFKEYAIKSVRYWFDDQTEPRTASYAGGTAAVDASALLEGYHTLHYQVVDDQGDLSPVRTTAFYRLSPSGLGFKEYAIKSVRYWFDDQTEPRTAAYAGGTASLEASALLEGYHTLHYQVVDDQGDFSPVRTTAFYRLSPSGLGFKEYAIKGIRYWFDEDVEGGKEASVVDGSSHLDLSALSEGTHILHYQAVTDDGQLSPTHSAVFERYLYDIYVSTDTSYDMAAINGNQVLAAKPHLKLHYDENDLTKRGHLTVAADALLSLGKYAQTGNWGTNNTVNKYNKTGADYYHPTTLVNLGFMRADSVEIKQNVHKDRWHFFSLPFNAHVSDMVVPDGTYWALRTYDGEERAAGNLDETWKGLRPGDLMESHKGYILQLTNDNGKANPCLIFKAVNDTHKNDIFTAEDVSIVLDEYQAEFAHNRSWNLIGNPYPSFYDSRCIDFEGIITVWNGTNYAAYSTVDDKYVLMPFEAFFVQRPVSQGSLTFAKEGRQHSQVPAEQPAHAKRMMAPKDENRLVFNFVLTDGEQSDHTRIVLNEQSTDKYEIGRDAAKFVPADMRHALLYTLEGGVKYAINERPMLDGVALLSVFIPHEGDYRLTIDQPTANGREVMVYDNETHVATALADGYDFHAEAGHAEGRFVVSFNGAADNISQATTFDDGEARVCNGCLHFNFIGEKAVKVFGTEGKVYYNGSAEHGSIALPKGIHVIVVEGKSTKVVVR